jgi:ABC-type lipoprotein release transport system permease subunit
MLFGITAFDVPTYFIVGAVLIGAVAAATLLPARRAANIEPMRSLRSE